MSDLPTTLEFAETAYRATDIVSLPESPNKRSRIGDELQPYGAYANLNPYHRVV